MKLQGFRTYYLVILGLLYLIGAFAGYYKFDERVLAGLGLTSLAFLRAGVKADVAKIGFCVAALAVLCTGCKSPEVGAYQSLATITTTVDTAMTVWGDAIAKKIPSDDQVAQSRIYYARYQGAMRIARELTLSLKNAEVDQATWEKGVYAAAAAADAIIDFVYSILPDQKPVGTKSLSRL